jgi:PAS domain S-box-containing protein
VLSADLQGTITACNAAALHAFGRPPQDLLGQPLTSLAQCETSTARHELQKALVSSVLKEGHYKCARRFENKLGQLFPAELSVMLLRDGRSVPSSMVAFLWVAASGSATAAEPEERESEASPVAAEQAVSRQMDGTSFIVASPLMHKFMLMVERVSGHTETVLITGETGTGKELVARTIHQSSKRRGRPWIDINCAALPENLVESELFGYEKGAFTGADASRPGLFELADRGTLFLDEIGELQLPTQVKLLRVLDGHPFYRLGGHRKITVDVRIVAATNQDLEAAVADGRFRQDLFHRLGQFQLRVPPLRERPEDIVALAEHFLELKTPGSFFAAEAISQLLSHGWPGNVRELRNLIARVALQATTSEIQQSQIDDILSGAAPAAQQNTSVPAGNLDSMEEQMIIRALEKSGGHRGQAADQLGISRRTLSRKLKEYNINAGRGGGPGTLGFVSGEQQKFFRVRIQFPVLLKNQQGDEVTAQGVNLSTGGLGLDALKEPMRFSGLLDVSFPLPESEITFKAKARIVWLGDEGRVGLHFVVIDPALFEQLQRWATRKMKDEGWDLPA